MVNIAKCTLLRCQLQISLSLELFMLETSFKICLKALNLLYKNLLTDRKIIFPTSDSFCADGSHILNGLYCLNGAF